MQDIRLKAIALLAKYAAWGVGAADIVQYMHNVATVVCPLGPRVLTFVGRKNSFTSNPKGLLPDTNSPADQLIDLFAAKTINFKDLIALVGAHTTAKQQFVDPSKAGQSLDSTPGVWDVKSIVKLRRRVLLRKSHLWNLAKRDATNGSYQWCFPPS
jgi:manganese peroxidase